MRRTASLLMLVIAPAFVLATAASAGTQVDRLRLQRSCGAGDATISVLPEPSLSGAIEVEGEIAGQQRDGGTAIVQAACGDGPLTIRVPPGLAVTVDASGPGRLQLGDLAGPVTARLGGDADLDAGRLQGGVVLNLLGPGDASIGFIGGTAALELPGSGDLAVGEIDSGTVTIGQSGSGDVAIGKGRIGTIGATLSGSGDLDVTATVGGGQIVSTGSGDAAFDRVLGSLAEVRSGSGDIDVHARDYRSSKEGAGGNGKIAPVLILAVVLAGGAVLALIRRRPKGAKAVDPRVVAAADRLGALARRVGRLEALVTSREFELDRRFRQMGD